eukprot:801256-Pleurochrysis_carterae.AAC.1
MHFDQEVVERPKAFAATTISAASLCPPMHGILCPHAAFRHFRATFRNFRAAFRHSRVSGAPLDRLFERLRDRAVHALHLLVDRASPRGGARVQTLGARRDYVLFPFWAQGFCCSHRRSGGQDCDRRRRRAR